MKQQHELTAESAPLIESGTRAAVLFGAYLARLRGEHLISIEALCFRSDVVRTWYDAAEHGAIHLSEWSVCRIGVMFQKVGVDCNLVEVALELRACPLGNLALELAPLALAGLDETKSRGRGEKAMSGIRDTLSDTDKLLVVTPILGLAATSWLAARSLEWALESRPGATSGWGDSLSRIVEYVNAVLMPASFIGALSVLLGLRTLDRAFSWVSRKFRSRSRKRHLAFVQLQYKPVRIPLGRLADDWDLSEVDGALTPTHRATAVRCALRCSLAERLTPMLMTGLFVSIAATAAAMSSEVTRLSYGVLLAVSGVAMALVILNRSMAQRLAGECAAAVSDGLGYSRELTRPGLNSL